MSKKLVVSDGVRERELQLVGRLVVGRDPVCDITLDHPLLSRRHAEFVTAGDLVVVRDLGSRNGVFVNGAKTAEQSLRPGDVVQVGPLRAEYVLDRAPLSIAPEDHDADRTAVMHAVPAEVAATPIVPSAEVEDDEVTRLITARPRSASEASSVAVVERPAAAPVLDDDEVTRFISAPQPRPDIDNEVTTEEMAVASPPAPSLRNFVFFQVLVLGAAVLASAAISLRVGGVGMPLVSLVLPAIVVAVGGYLVSGVIDRRLSGTIAQERQRD